MIPSYSILYSATVAGTGTSGSPGDVLIPDSTTGLFVVATAANRGTRKATGIALTSYVSGGVVDIQQFGSVDPVTANLGAGTASAVRVSTTGVLERCVPVGGDDVVGYVETDGTFHACFGVLTNSSITVPITTGAQLATAAAAATAAGTGLVISSPIVVSTALGTIATPLQFTATGSISCVPGGSVLLSGALDAPARQIFFDTSGGGPGLRVRSKVQRALPQWWGATGDGVTDDTAAIAAALTNLGQSVPGTLFFLPGTYIISAPITCAKSGVRFDGAGPDSAFIKAAAGFAGTAMFILGNKSTTTVTSKMGMTNLTLDCNGQSGVRGIEFYALRDATTFDSLYITGCKLASGVYCNQAGDTSGSATGRMSEGVQFRNVHVVTSNDMTGSVWWELGGLFESQLIGCKALGSSVASTANAFGFRIGNTTESRGVVLHGCSAGNISAGGGNTGILYGEWAYQSWDQFTTFEYITGTCVRFHGGTSSGSTLPAQCFSIAPRIYNLVTAGIMDPVYEFGVSTGCRAGPVIRYNGSKVWVNFLSGAGSSNVAEVHHNVSPETMVGSIVNFTAGCPNDSMVIGYGLFGGNPVTTTMTPNLVARPAVTGSRNGPTAMTSLISTLAARGVITDSTASGLTAVSIGVTGSNTPDASIRDIYVFTITAAGVTHTTNNATNPTTGAVLTITYKNTSGSTMTAAFGTAYKLSAWTNPATGFNRSITFRYDGTNWIEVSRTPSDVPN